MSGKTPAEQFGDLLKWVHSDILKPLGYKKEGQNFRLFTPDGLGKVICFSKDRANNKDYLAFRLDIGVYFEEEPIIREKRFKEYECQLRQLINRQDSGTLQKKRLTDLFRLHDWRENLEDRKWLITAHTNTEALYASVQKGVEAALQWFANFPGREEVIRMILSGKAEQYSWSNPLSYTHARQLANMGYAREVYERIKDTDPVHCHIVQLARELKEQEGL